MLSDLSSYSYYVKPGNTDMRCGIDTLMQKVIRQMEKDPFSRSMFLFLSKSRRMLAVLVWDRNGFWLMKKRLQSGTFPWPKDAKEAMELTADDIHRLLDGEDVFRRLPVLTGSLEV